MIEIWPCFTYMKKESIWNWFLTKMPEKICTMDLINGDKTIIIEARL